MNTKLREMRATPFASVFYDGRNRYVGSVMKRTVDGKCVWEATRKPLTMKVPESVQTRTRKLAISMLEERKTA